ncbi:MAG: hypothetical protein D6706_07475, partial [Chloroflexi bacterium]
MGKKKKVKEKKRQVPESHIAFIHCTRCGKAVLNIEAVSLVIQNVPISVCKPCYRKATQSGSYD